MVGAIGDDTTETWQIEARAVGMVQRVGFRWHILDAAAMLKVGGHIRNLPDGAIEMVATGPRPALESLIERFRQGPHGARVDQVEVTWTRLAEPALRTRFEVRS